MRLYKALSQVGATRSTRILSRLRSEFSPRCSYSSTLAGVEGSGDESGCYGGGQGSSSSSGRQHSQYQYTSRLPRYSFFGQKVGPLQVYRAMLAGHLFFPGNFFSTQSNNFDMSNVAFDQVASETLNSLHDLLDDLQGAELTKTSMNVSLQNNVLTLTFGEDDQSYVVYLQKPNKQIWMTTCNGDTKKYNFVEGVWRCSVDHITLHDMLTMEVSEVVGLRVDFSQCSFGQRILQGIVM